MNICCYFSTVSALSLTALFGCGIGSQLLGAAALSIGFRQQSGILFYSYSVKRSVSHISTGDRQEYI